MYETEYNSSHFEIEQSVNNTDFKKTGVLKAGQANYSFTDSIPASMNYYRLKMVDIDGQSKYSNVVALHKNSTETIFSRVYPNPFRDQLKLNVSVTTEHLAKVTVLDNAGHVLLRENHPVSPRSNTISLNSINKLPAGIYLVRISMDNEVFSKTVVKQ
jgi:hypothetical protein